MELNSNKISLVVDGIMVEIYFDAIHADRAPYVKVVIDHSEKYGGWRLERRVFAFQQYKIKEDVYKTIS